MRPLPEMHADQGDVLRGDGIGAGDLCGESIPPSWSKHVDPTKRYQAAFLLDIISCAKRTGRLAQLPNADVVYAMVKQQRPDKAGGKKERRGIGAKLLRFPRRKAGRPAKASRRPPSRVGGDT